MQNPRGGEKANYMAVLAFKKRDKNHRWRIYINRRRGSNSGTKQKGPRGLPYIVPLFSYFCYKQP
jgi:hypothetical protein